MENLVRQDVCIAFSGGVDSSLLLFLAGRFAQAYNTKVYGVTFDTKLHPAADLKIAAQIAKDTGTRHHVIHLDELDHPAILDNPTDRCYLCKKMLFEKLMEFACSKQISCVIEGTNRDDRSAYRPGLKAVKELGIQSPLDACGFTKAEVRRYAEECGLAVSNRPSTPCLATRLPYGTRIEWSVLKKIEKGEEFLRSLGFYNVRLRVHKNLARIEIDTESLEQFLQKKEEIIPQLKMLGFQYITLDLEGFRSGSMDVKTT